MKINVTKQHSTYDDLIIDALKGFSIMFRSRCREAGYKCETEIETGTIYSVKATVYANYDVVKLAVRFVNDVYTLFVLESVNDFNPIKNQSSRTVSDRLLKQIKHNDYIAQELLNKEQSESNESLSMDVEDFLSDATDAANWLTDKLADYFDSSYYAKAYISNNLGPSLNVHILNVPPSASSLERSNAKMRVSFMMHLAGGNGRVVAKDKFELELLQMSYQVRDAGIKYRKIAGKSPMEVARKFFEWVKKNESILKGAYQ